MATGENERNMSCIVGKCAVIMVPACCVYVGIVRGYGRQLK